MKYSWGHLDRSGIEKTIRCSKYTTRTCFLLWVLVAGLWLAPTGVNSLVAATVGADAVVLVNSSSARYQDFKRSIQPYLDNFGVAYTVFDIATNAVGTNVGNYAVIIVGHSQLDINHAYLDATGQRNVLAAVRLEAPIVTILCGISLDSVLGRPLREPT